MKGFSLRYSILSSRLDQLWFPAAFWLLFAITAVFMKNTDKLPIVARSYLGCAAPLTAGVLAAYALLDDAALELRFATPVPAWWTLVERLGFILIIQGAGAFAFQLLVAALGADLSVLGGWGAVQLAWIVPCLTLMSAGSLAALAGCKPTSGALAAGLIWLVEILARGWLAASDWGRYLLIFMGALMPDHPSLHANQFTLLALCCAFFFTGWILFRRQERYLS